LRVSAVVLPKTTLDLAAVLSKMYKVQLKAQLQDVFKAIKVHGPSIAGALFNADSAFDGLEARKVCFKHRLIPNIPAYKRNRIHPKRGRKRFFDPRLATLSSDLTHHNPRTLPPGSAFPTSAFTLPTAWYASGA
jgi:hypothetical protein